MSALARILEEFGSQPAPLPAQLAAAQALREHSLPTRRDENWRYANLRALDGVARFLPGPGPAQHQALPALPAALPGFDRLVYIDGRLQHQWSATALAKLKRRAPEDTEQAGTPFETAGDGRFGLIARMFAPEPLALQVSGEVALEVLSLSTSAAVANYTELSLELKAGARLELVERSCAAERAGPGTEVGALMCSTLRLQQRSGSQLTHTRLQQAPARALLYDTVSASLAEGASYQLRHLAAGGATTRSSVQVQLQGRDASVDIRALAAAQQEQYADALYTILHEAPGTQSHLMFRGIASDRAHVACSADVQATPGAPGSRVRQSLRGLIGGKGAEINLRPRLTINTDDIQAAHGATTGRLDEDLLFYLLSRGISPAAARSLLKWAFLSEILGTRGPAAAAQGGRIRRRGPPQRRTRGGVAAMSAPRPVGADAYFDAHGALRAERVRADFPILSREVHGRALVYLDSAASSQQPRAVLDAVDYYSTRLHANVHRGVHALSQEATAAFEGARETVRSFINARSTREIIFTRGTTEAINLVARSWGTGNLRAGDEVLITHLEHHSNIVPWQMICAATGARLLAAPLTEAGEVDLPAFEQLISARTRLVAIAHVSNALGTVLPVGRMIALAHARGIPVLLDGAQAIAHQRVDVQQLDCDFYAFSGHKVYAPTGIGVLYGRESLLTAMPPWQGGGDMILTVAIERSTYNELPWKFEAGTPNISGAVGLGAALEYLQGLGRERVTAHEQLLLSQATARLRASSGTETGRHRSRPGRSYFIHAARHTSARRRHHSRPPRHRGAQRPSLRHAGNELLRLARHGARLLRVLQHERRYRPAGGRPGERARGVCLMEIRDLYRDVILDHNRSPRNFGRLEPADGAAVGHNPLCGDALSVTVRLDGDRLRELRFNGQGCAISIASASMMGEAVSGKTLAEVEHAASRSARAADRTGIRARGAAR